MDPLSITSAIAGLIVAGAKVFGLLEAISSIKDSPSIIKDARNELQHTNITIKALQRLLEQRERLKTRGELIQVDELRVVLSDVMLQLSELETFLEFLARLEKLRVAIMWGKYCRKLEEHLARLQRHKLSLSLILNILQW